MIFKFVKETQSSYLVVHVINHYELLQCVINNNELNGPLMTSPICIISVD